MQKAQEEKKRIAIVTGASSGLGRIFAELLDKAEKGRYDEIWAIARRQDRLESLQEQIRTPVRTLPFDLTRKESVQAIGTLLAEEEPDVRLLINAAGFGKIGRYDEIPLSQVDDMIDLNCRAAVDMTQICLPYMREGARIMEICSTAGFQPFQYLNVYAASKAFLYRYSRALRVELLPRKILVTAVCPYWIRDTEFIPVARSGKPGETGPGAEEIRSFPFASSADRVAARALADSEYGLAVSTPGPVCTIHRFFAHLLPADFLMACFAGIRRIPAGKK